MGNILKQTKSYQTLKNNIDIHIKILTISLMVGIAFLVSLDALSTNEALAQRSSSDNQLLKINVQVTNNADINEIGSIHIIVDGTGISKDLNTISFPVSKTVTHVFEFDSEDIPVGTGFSVEVVYGDDLHKRAYGVNSESNVPEILDIAIP